MKKLWKAIVITLVITMLGSLLVGCGSSSNNSSTPATEGQASESGDSAQASGNPELTLMLYWGTADNEYDPFAIAAHTFTDILVKNSNGRIKVDFYPNSVLGAERDAFEGVSMGTIDMALINNTPISGFVPECQVLDLPYLYPDKETIYRIFDGEIGKQIDQKILDQYNVMSLGIFDGGFRQMYNNVRPIVKPEDMKGIKFRSMESPLYMNMFKNLGANPTAMAYTEVYTGLQQGTVDGFEIGISTFYTNKFYEVTKYMSLTNHTFTSIRLLMSKDKWDTIPEDLQQIILDSVKEALPIAREKNDANEQKMLEMIKAEGIEINEIADPEAFKKACEPVWYILEDQIGKDLLKSVIEAVAQK